MWDMSLDLSFSRTFCIVIEIKVYMLMGRMFEVISSFQNLLSNYDSHFNLYDTGRNFPQAEQSADHSSSLVNLGTINLP